ncbi:RING finger protein [Quillaja saponaria]|uniref:RING-type E3 ubiquitin transferase n=1 Tax=Quillaja saponaria TaxID=32244 RepID=A0AAD7VJF1_QUISA|nr:RING finger protein [Quillaja saponaria]
MGVSSSTRRRNRHHNQHPYLPQSPSSSSAIESAITTNTTSATDRIPSESSSSSPASVPSHLATRPILPLPPPPPPPPLPPSSVVSTAVNHSIPSSSSPFSFPPLSSNSQPTHHLPFPPAPVPPTIYPCTVNAPYPSNPLPPPSPPYPSNFSYYAPPPMSRSNYYPYNSSRVYGPPVLRSQLPSQPPPAYVEQKSTKKIKNDVNVHKDTIKLELDEKDMESYLVSFTFDALVDGSLTIIYFAKEGVGCTLTSLYPEIYMPRSIPFQKGLGQKFSQPSGTGIDLGFFDLSDLSKPSPEEDVFPLVISAETCLSPLSFDQEHSQPLPTISPHAQITQAVLDKNKEGQFHVRVVKQILWIDGVRYELREIYGIANSDEAGLYDGDSGEECVICMTEPKDTAALPCRHMCMCSECAKALRLQSNKCPICRQPIQELMEIKINKAS